MLYEERYFIRELNGHPGLIRVAVSLSAPEDTTRATLDSTRIRFASTRNTSRRGRTGKTLELCDYFIETLDTLEPNASRSTSRGSSEIIGINAEYNRESEFPMVAFRKRAL